MIDLNLPDEDGIVLTRMLRARSTIPIIVVTARTAPEDRLVALEIGADDFITKPFDPRELMFRLSNILLRGERLPARIDAQMECAGGHLDLRGRSLIDTQGRTIELSSSEFGLLSVLAKSRGRALTRAQLIDAVAHGEPPESECAIDILVSRLLRKMKVAGLDASRLRTMRGYGYKLEASRIPRFSDNRSVSSKAWA